MYYKTKPTTKDAALKWVDETRAFLDLDPIATLSPGIPGHPQHCPLSCSISDDNVYIHVGRTKYRAYRQYDYRSDGGGSFEFVAEGMLPPEVQKFVSEFDSGRYPELIDKELLDDWNSE